MVIRFLLEKEFKQMMRNIILPIVFILLPIGVIHHGAADGNKSFPPRCISISAMSTPPIPRLWRAWRQAMLISSWR